MKFKYLVVLFLILLKSQWIRAMTTSGPVETTENPCFVQYGCLNGADCPSGACVCKEGFTGVLCGQSALIALETQVLTQAGSADLAEAAEFSQTAQTMMDNQLGQAYSGMKTSVESTNTIATTILTIIKNDNQLAENAVVDLSALTADVTEMTTDVLQGTKQAETVMTYTELETAVTLAEDNLIKMVNLMLDKRDTGNTSSTAIDTTDVSLRVVKAKGKDIPVEYKGRDAGFALPFFETFQDKQRKKNLSINVLTYAASPYIYVDNENEVGSSVIKLQVLDKNDKEEKDIKDKDDPIDVFVNTNKMGGDTYFEDMTESSTDSGVYMSYVDTNETAGGFMMEIKLTSLKICDIYGKYNTFPDKDDYDLYVITKGKSRIIDRHPLDLAVTFKKQIVKLTLSPESKGDGALTPFVITASCQDDRLDSAKRKKRATGISLVRHQFRTGLLSVKTLESGAGNWTSTDQVNSLGADNGQIQFKSHFFGTFSADMFFIGPTPIDFSKIFGNFIANLANSPYALSAIIVIIVIFILLTVPLRRFDKNDDIMWSYLPLLDNPAGANVVYFIAVETSVTSSKVIASSVYINIIGKNGSSGTRKLDDGTRKNFKRGTSSHFEMRLATDLGDLKTIQIWHDNIDGKTAWHLRKVTIIKADAVDRYTFLCGKWLSLNSEDGQTWRSIDVLDDNMIETDVLFYNLSNRKLFDDHLWISLFSRPRFSKFTRVQRLWCLVALLFLAMISSAMWYDQPDDAKVQTISLGPLKLSYKQFYVGFMSAMIALIPSMILVLIFRNRKFKGEEAKGCYIPWWFVIFAYILIFLCVSASATFVFLYSLQWGGPKSLEWMVSFVLSIIQSVIVLEPIKAILLAIVIACMFKKMGSQELSDRYIPVPNVDQAKDNNDLEKMEAANSNPALENLYPDFPGTEKESAELVVARERAQTDKRLWTKLQSWLGILLYVMLVATISSHSDVSSAYLQNTHILNTLTTIYVPNSTDEIYDYIKTTYLRAVFPKWWETEDDELLRPAHAQRFTLNAYNFRLTLSRLRQVRVNGNCSGPEETNEAVDTCIPSFKKSTEETGNFCLFWNDFNETGCFDENEEFHYSFLYTTTSESAGDLTYIGQHGIYGPGGYYVDLGPKQSLVTQYLDLLKATGWIDIRTRALFLDVVTYNANTRLFSHIKIVFELPATGALVMKKEVWSANLYPYIYPLDYLVLFFQIIFVVVLLVRFILLVVTVIKTKTRALTSISTYLRLLEVMLGIGAIVCCILRIDATISAITALKKSIGRYVSFELVRIYDAAYLGCLAGVLFIITLELLKPLEFNYHFFMLVSSMKIARWAIIAFMGIIAVEIISFASLLNLAIGRTHDLFKSLGESIYTLMLALLGMMTYQSEEFDDLLVKFYIGLYTMTTTITLVNVFIVLLTISFNDVKAGLDSGQLHYDQKMNNHFWYKVDKTLQWLANKFCFRLHIRKRNQLEQLQDCLEKLKSVTRKIDKNDLVREKLAAKLMIQMIRLDNNRTKLDNLNIQRNEFATKYIFGFRKTGETFVILTVPVLSCTEELDVKCFEVSCLRRDIVRRMKNKNVGKTYMFVTKDNNKLKGSILLELLGENQNVTFNYVVAKLKNGSPWDKRSGHKTKYGIQASVEQVPLYCGTMFVDEKMSDLGWKPFEKYKVSNEGGTVYPSYDPEAKISFSENTFNEPCTVSLRTKPGETTSVLNVVLDVPTSSPSHIHLPEIMHDQMPTDNPAEYIIALRSGPDDEWRRLNSVLTKTENGFDFSFGKSKPWSNIEVTVKNSEFLWVEEFQLRSKYDVNLIKAIVMVSKIKEVSECWRQMAGLLNIPEAEIETSEQIALCQEEKCFMVFQKWLDKTEVTFKMLTSLLTALGLRVIAEHIRKKWIINNPSYILPKLRGLYVMKKMIGSSDENSLNGS